MNAVDYGILLKTDKNENQTLCHYISRVPPNVCCRRMLASTRRHCHHTILPDRHDSSTFPHPLNTRAGTPQTTVYGGTSWRWISSDKDPERDCSLPSSQRTQPPRYYHVLSYGLARL